MGEGDTLSSWMRQLPEVRESGWFAILRAGYLGMFRPWQSNNLRADDAMWAVIALPCSP